jgi:hypothetical protein
MLRLEYRLPRLFPLLFCLDDGIWILSSCPAVEVTISSISPLSQYGLLLLGSDDDDSFVRFRFLSFFRLLCFLSSPIMTGHNDCGCLLIVIVPMMMQVKSCLDFLSRLLRCIYWACSANIFLVFSHCLFCFFALSSFRRKHRHTNRHWN